MRAVTKEDLRELVSVKNKTCVSLYMPTTAGLLGSEDEVRLRGLVAAAERQLVRGGMLEEAVEGFIAPLRKLPLTTEWHDRTKGLAMFCSPDLVAEFWLNAAFEPQVQVDRVFHIKPLLPHISPSLRFHILTISRHDVRLLEADANGCRRLQVPGLPKSIEKSLNLQGADRGAQVHSATIIDLGKESAVFHGQGGHRETDKEEFREYCREISRAVSHALNGSQDPLILAGVEYELAIFRTTCDSHFLMCDAIFGGTDYLSDMAIYDRALPIAREYQEKMRRTPLEKYRTMNRRILTSEDMDEILAGAVGGKIETLIVDPNSVVMGRFDPLTNQLDLGRNVEGAKDLTELAIAETLAHRGSILTLPQEELPEKASMCAVFRYR
jgi:hypothetical protein